MTPSPTTSPAVQAPSKQDQQKLDLLLQKICTDFTVEFEPLHVDDTVLEVLAIRNMQAHVDKLLQRKAIRNPLKDLPLWAKIWPGSFVLGRFLRKYAPEGKSLLELGSGCGVLSLIAARYGFSRILLTRVDNRTRWCLIPLICRHVLPGTTIISDEWSAYKTLDIMSDYRHLTVNHSKTFKDPITGVTTNKIEGAWAHLRRFLPSTGVRDRFIEDFLAAFIMRNRRTITFPEFAKMVIYLKETEEAAHKDAIKTEDEVELHMSEAEKEIWHDLHERGTYCNDGDESVQENSIASHDEANSSDADEVPILGDLRDESSSSDDPYGAGTGEEASEYVDD